MAGIWTGAWWAIGLLFLAGTACSDHQIYCNHAVRCTETDSEVAQPDAGRDETATQASSDESARPAQSNTAAQSGGAQSAVIVSGVVPAAPSTTDDLSDEQTEAESLLPPGASCEQSSQCAEGSCQPAESNKRCCIEECGAEEFCSETGQCFSCSPGAKEECWESPEGESFFGDPTGEGTCQIGERACTAEGQWSGCEGAVGPALQDRCEQAGADDDCDGTPNAGCECIEGMTRPCGSDVGNCEFGEQTCVDSAWSECVGEVTQETQDDCALEGDDANCDGTPNGNCGCIGTESRDCNDCGTQTCSLDARDWSACSAPQNPAETRCVEGSQSLVETCSAQGLWEASSCEFVCSNGSCGGTCTPGQTRCQGNPERRESCVDGAWDLRESCGQGSECVGDGTECKRSNGGSCVGDDECASGICTDGLCCTSTCTPANCSSYDTQCLIHPANVAENLCGNDGTCRPTAEICADAAAPRPSGAQCDYPNLPGGRCDGNGECKPPSVSCGEQSCSLDAQVCCWKWVAIGVQVPECSSAAQCDNTGDEGPDREIRCDEHTDCADDQQCCWQSGRDGRSTYCYHTCPNSNPSSGWKDICETPVASYSCPSGTYCDVIEHGFAICEPDE